VKQNLALRTVIFGGEALELQGLRPWFERHGDKKPRLVNMYGITENLRSRYLPAHHLEGCARRAGQRDRRAHPRFADLSLRRKSRIWYLWASQARST